MLIQGVDIVTGNKDEYISNAAIQIKNRHITDIQSSFPPEKGEKVLDRKGKLAIPGIINTHAHACLSGPFSPHGDKPFSPQRIRQERKKHIMAGETTVFNLCGFVLQQDVDMPYEDSLRVIPSTSHTKHCLKAASIQAGEGLTPRHFQTTVTDRIREGVTLIGEVGAGGLLGGGTTDYKLIPEAIEAISGVWLDPDQARRLKWAVLGKKLRKDDFDLEALKQCVAEFGIENVPLERLKKVIHSIVLPPLDVILKGYEDAVSFSASTGLPAILHNCPFVLPNIISLAQKYPNARVVAAHSNQADFQDSEVIECCRRLKAAGVIVDISTWDVASKQRQADPKRFKALLRSGLVDTVSTDFAGGDWDPVLKGMAMAVTEKALSIVEAVRLMSANARHFFPEIIKDRGILAPGRDADIVIVDSENIEIVTDVIIEGRPVLEDGIPCWTDNG